MGQAVQRNRTRTGRRGLNAAPTPQSPFHSIGIELVTAIAGEFPWSHESIMELEATAALYYALVAKRRKWERIEDMRQAATFPHQDERGARALIQQINFMTSGPGRMVKWEDTLSLKAREAAANAEDELDETYRRLQEMGILLNVDGTRPVAALLRKQEKK